MKYKIKTDEFKINDLDITIPPIEVEAEFEAKEMVEMYDLSKKMITEMPGMIEKFVMDMFDSFEKAETRIQEKEERDIINSVKGMV